MKSTDGSDDAKRRAGESAAAEVEDGTTIGLGTGSTAAHAIRALGRAIEDGLDIRGVPTSFGTRALAREVDIPCTDLDEGEIDVAIDGADQVAIETDAMIKGGGAAHAREKLVAWAARRLLVVVDETKVVDRLERPVPVEVLPDSLPVVSREVEALGGDPGLRTAINKDGPVITDNGNLVLDCEFGPIEDPRELAASLSVIPGCVEHGLFCGAVDELHVGTDTGVEITHCGDQCRTDEG